MWSNERRPPSQQSASGSPNSRAGDSAAGGGSPGQVSPTQNIGNLRRGTPCIIRYPFYGEAYGFVMQATADRKHMEVGKI